jgi:hypothetical protein
VSCRPRLDPCSHRACCRRGIHHRWCCGVIIALLWLRLDAVTSQRDSAFAALSELRAKHLEQCYLLKEGNEMRELAIRNAEEFLATQQADDPSGEWQRDLDELPTQR